MDTTIETWKSTFGSFVRFALGGVVAWLVQKGVVTATQGEFLLIEAIAGGLALATMAYAWYKNKTEAKLANAQIVIARAADITTPVEVIKTEAKAQVANA